MIQYATRTLLAMSAAIVLAPAAHAVVIATSKGLGADAEVRDHQPTTNFGLSSELGTRIVDNFPSGHANDGSDRFSAMYLKFDLTGQTVLPNQTTSVRLTYRNTILTANRIHDTTPPRNNMGYRTGLAFYGLDRDHAGNNWSESTITYLNAPGLAFGGDFNIGTKDFDFADPDGAGPSRAPLTPLGVALFPEVPPQNHLPVGGELIFSNDALNNFVTLSLNAGKSTVTIVSSIAHDGKIPINDWKNFNYLFNPKEQTTLNEDSAYDSDVTNPNNPLGSPWSKASNVEDARGFSPFSPQLIIDSAQPGDFNLDGSANAADYAVWRDTLGSTTKLAADGNGNTMIDAGDYGVWQANFGDTSGAGNGALVPEPGSFALTMFALSAALATLHRARPRRQHAPTHDRFLA